MPRPEATFEPMNHIILVVLVAVWAGGNVYLWSMKQSQVILFWESLGMAALAYPALYRYVIRK
jgi:hypothetical protein